MSEQVNEQHDAGERAADSHGMVPGEARSRRLAGALVRR